MHISASDKAAFNPPVVTKRTKPSYNWQALRKKYGYITATELHKKTGIPLKTIYRASKRGDITLKPHSIDWKLVSLFSADYTIRELAKRLKAHRVTVEKAVERGLIQCKQYKSIKERPRDSKGRFTA